MREPGYNWTGWGLDGIGANVEGYTGLAVRNVCACVLGCTVVGESIALAGECK